MRAKFYGIKCNATVVNGTPKLTGSGFFNNCALNFAAQIHRLKSRIAGKDLPLNVTFEDYDD